MMCCPMFYDALMRSVAGLNASAAVEAGINSLVWGAFSDPPVKFVGAPTCEINSYAPLQTTARGNSSCTGLALLVCMGMRSVGIPARVAGVPHWDQCGCGNQDCTCATCPNGDVCSAADDQCGNHDWIEVYVDGAWHFVDPEGSKTLDDGWFAARTKIQSIGRDGFYNHSILATSWAPTDTLNATLYPQANPIPYFLMVWDWPDKSVPGWDVTERYLGSRTELV